MPVGSRGEVAIEVSAAFTALAGIVVLLRLYTRLFIVRCTGVEDYFIMLALICSIGLTVCIGIQVQHGMGLPGKTLLDTDLESSLKAFWASLITYYLSLGLTKSSILLQYRRVFQTKPFQKACWIIISVVIVYTVWTVFGSVFACVPVRAFWTLEKPAKCIDQFAMWFTNAGINIITDLAVIILPIPLIQKLNLAKRQKQALIGVFAIGGFVCIVSILRLQSLIAISNSDDPTYDNPSAATWSAVESNVGIICSCLPCLRPLISRYFPRLLSGGLKYGGTSGQSPYRRSRYGHNVSEHGIILSSIRQDRSYRSEQFRRFDDDIKVVTEVRVSVEGNGDYPATCLNREHDLNLERENSTETLVTEIGHLTAPNSR